MTLEFPNTYGDIVRLKLARWLLTGDIHLVIGTYVVNAGEKLKVGIVQCAKRSTNYFRDEDHGCQGALADAL